MKNFGLYDSYCFFEPVYGHKSAIQRCRQPPFQESPYNPRSLRLPEMIKNILQHACFNGNAGAVPPSEEGTDFAFHSVFILNDACTTFQSLAIDN